MSDVPRWASDTIREARERQLKWLDLSGWVVSANNKLTDIPAGVFALEQLEILDLSGNALFTVPDKIVRLKNLTELNLSGNQLAALPKAMAQLQNLAELWLSNNNFTAIPDVVFELSALENLDFSNLGSYLTGYKEVQLPQRNTIREITPAILQLANLKTLNLRGNPVTEPPPEITGNLRNIDLKKARNYYRQLEAEGVDHLYEAKLLIVGEGGAGKTTLAQKIIDRDYELQDEDTTRGIEVIEWDFPMENGETFRVNIWDFGGQEVYHATHQFFLTKRSLYALVADTRKEDTDFTYWLNVVELLSGNSPLLIVKNEKQDRQRQINERQLRGRFTNLKETLATNLATNRGLDNILDDLKHYVTRLPLVGTPLPKTWVKVREALEQNPRNHIGLDEFLDICGKNGFKRHEDAMQLSGYLHDLGVCLHFQDDPLLKKTVILKPQWGTDGVYKVLDNKTVINNLGRFTREDLADIWQDEAYATMQDELLQLMINFKLCYRISGDEDTYTAPQLLTENQPDYHWNETDNLNLRYDYEFMPKGIITRFIVAVHQLIDGDCVWKSGVILKRDGAWAEVIEDYERRGIRIRVAGENKKALLTIVSWELEQIHSSFHGLRYDMLVPCNCSQCANSPEPEFYPYEIARKFALSGRAIQCRESFEMVDAASLIDDVIDRGQLLEHREAPGSLDGAVFSGPTTIHFDDHRIRTGDVDATAASIGSGETNIGGDVVGRDKKTGD